MPKLVPISGKRIVKILYLAGFDLIRIKGSHHFFKNRESGDVTTVPIHSNEDLGIRMLKSILRDVKMSRNEYEKLRQKI